MKKAWDEICTAFRIAACLEIVVFIIAIIIAPFQFVGEHLPKLRSKFHLKEEK